MKRLRLTALLAILLAAVAASAIASARSAKPARANPLIKGEEVGYFGTGLVAHHLSVFVYSSSEPRAGTRVTVCVKGVCKPAVGHTAPTAWYTASFVTSPLPMAAAVKFTVMVSDSHGRAKATVTQGLLCMHNNGSTPQQS